MLPATAARVGAPTRITSIIGGAAKDSTRSARSRVACGSPQLAARFVLNRCAARTVIARETAETLADHDPPLLAATIGQRVAFADTAQTGRLVGELDQDSAAAREIAALATEIGRIAP